MSRDRSLVHTTHTVGNFVCLPSTSYNTLTHTSGQLIRIILRILLYKKIMSVLKKAMKKGSWVGWWWWWLYDLIESW